MPLNRVNSPIFATLFLCSSALLAQTPEQKAATDAARKEEVEQGTPIRSELVRKTCSPCHQIDEKQRMTRISYRRTTPEGWEITLKRMVSLNHLQLEPAAARDIVKYLSNDLGLAPEEAKPAYFEVERRMIEYRYTADKDTEATCTKCHSMGRVISQRRTKGDWEALVAMHRGYYPLSDFQAFRRMEPRRPQPTATLAPGTPAAPPPDERHPMDKAIAHLSMVFPLKTPEWSAWSANMRSPKLAGKWALSGTRPGKGPVYGQVIIAAKPGTEDEFTTAARFVFAKTGEQVEEAGKSTVFTGYQWRGRSGSLREVMFVDPNMREISGRWFTGAYEEIGYDVKLQRIGNDPVLLGLDRYALQSGSGTQAVTIHGANLPSGVDASAIDFGRGVKVLRVITSTPETIKLELEVAADAPLGKRDIFVSGAALAGAAVVYDKIDTIKVRPQAGMARVGGANFAKQLQQFEAIAFANGPDGKPDTKDDLELGPVNVAWSVEEYTAIYGDDDKEWVGKIDDSGLFTPNVDGPNPKRKNGGNNVGDVWVVAAYVPVRPGDKPDKKTIRGRAHLLVTVPLYMRWNSIEAPE